MTEEEKFLIEYFPVFYHSRMLADKHRLHSFKTAIKQTVTDGCSVVDIGGGTGILTKMIAQETKGQITYIDKSKASTIIAQNLLSNDLIGNNSSINFINKSSFDVQLECSPDIIVTETLGYFGIDEGIVETCYDFKNRHPYINKIIPHSIDLYCQFFYFPELEIEFENLLNSYLSNYEKISENVVLYFQYMFSNLIRTKFIQKNEVKICSKSINIGHFKLGFDQKSSIDYFLDARKHKNFANAIHFYFEASLADDVILSNHFLSPKTHWLHNYAGIPKESIGATISFSYGERKLRLRWV